MNSTLRASQKLCDEFDASITVARPLRERLQLWYSDLPPDLRIKPHAPPRDRRWSSLSTHGVAVLHFCYLTAELMLYRAILRTLTPSPPPALITDEEGFSMAGQINWEDVFLRDLNLNQLPSPDSLGSGEGVEAALAAAEKCAGIIANFTFDLTSNDFETMWYGCEWHLASSLLLGRSPPHMNSN